MSLALLVPLLGDVLDRILPDKEKAAEAKLRLIELQQAGQLQELSNIKEMSLSLSQVSQQEAKHDSLFVAGARPALIWVGAAAMAWQYLAFPMVQTYMLYNGSTIEIPAINNDALFELVCLLLGLGGLRTYEKVKKSA